jgi:hypothetical protein
MLNQVFGEDVVRFGDTVIIRNAETGAILMPAFTDPIDQVIVPLQETPKPYPQTPQGHKWWLTAGPYEHMGDPNVTNARRARQDVVGDCAVICLSSFFARGDMLAVRPRQRGDAEDFPMVGAGLPTIPAPEMHTCWLIQGQTKLKAGPGGGQVPAEDSSPTAHYRYGETFIQLTLITRYSPQGNAYHGYGPQLRLARDNPKRIYKGRSTGAPSDWWIFEKAPPVPKE